MKIAFAIMLLAAALFSGCSQPGPCPKDEDIEVGPAELVLWEADHIRFCEYCRYRDAHRNTHQCSVGTQEFKAVQAMLRNEPFPNAAIPCEPGDCTENPIPTPGGEQ